MPGCASRRCYVSTVEGNGDGPKLFPLVMLIAQYRTMSRYRLNSFPASLRCVPLASRSCSSTLASRKKEIGLNPEGQEYVRGPVKSRIKRNETDAQYEWGPHRSRTCSRVGVVRPFRVRTYFDLMISGCRNCPSAAQRTRSATCMFQV